MVVRLKRDCAYFAEASCTAPSAVEDGVFVRDVSNLQPAVGEEDQERGPLPARIADGLAHEVLRQKAVLGFPTH